MYVIKYISHKEQQVNLKVSVDIFLGAGIFLLSSYNHLFVQTADHGCSECTNGSAVSTVCQTTVSRQSRAAAVTNQTTAGTTLPTIRPAGSPLTAGTKTTADTTILTTDYED